MACLMTACTKSDCFHSLETMSEKKNKKGKDQESIQSSTTLDLGYQLESDNFTIRHRKQKPRGQPFSSSCPQAINKQTRTKA